MRFGVSVPAFGRGFGATGAIASALGVMVAISGFDHGAFELLQGNEPTTGLVIQAIGPDQRMWARGTEEAMTLAPTFLLAGIASLLVAVAILVWSVWFIGRPHGSTVFLGLGGLLLLAGGGIGMVIFVLFGWAVARRIGRPMTWWRAIVPPAPARTLARIWPALIVVVFGLYAIALEIAIAGVVPGVSDPDHLQLICWLTLLVMLGTMLAALVGASAQDLAEGARGAEGAGTAERSAGRPAVA
jgi:hypothetical protein